MMNNFNLSKKVKAVLGPTNTGKTHYAIERMLCYSSGIIGLPLRLLAREVYERVALKSGKHTVALVTGEERVMPSNPKYWVCTVEAMPVNMDFKFLAVDEIQMCSDLDRGHVFTERLLNARGSEETVFLGSSSIKTVLESILPRVEFFSRRRFSKLDYVDSRKLGKVPPRSAIVCFSIEEVYTIAELIRREKGGAAIVTGGLSPRTRNSQVQVYQNGDVDYLIATDAIGMGLNLDITNVSFASLYKFDGFSQRRLFTNELAQIAGRAGRYMSNGTFGVTASCDSLTPDNIFKIENHIFSDIKKLQWRNSNLSFDTLKCLINSLNSRPNRAHLLKARENIDQNALQIMSENNSIADRVISKDDVKLLWKICQIPDYRKISLSDHVQILEEIYLLLSDQGQLSERWLEKKIVSLDKYDGGIESLSKRLAYIRTWNYVANRGDWFNNPESLQENAKLIEDRLSDQLHKFLIERFIDRRTTVLIRKLREKEILTANLNDQGELFVEDQLIGKLEGLILVLDPSGSPHEKKTLLTLSKQAIKLKISIVVNQLYESPDSDFSLDNIGQLIWRGNIVGTLKAGKAILNPMIGPLIDEASGSTAKEKLIRRLRYFLERLIDYNMAPLLSLVGDKEISGISAGLVFILGEKLGIIPREEVNEEVKTLDQETRSKFRRHGVRFGQYSIFQANLLKPEPTRIRILLWNTFHTSSKVPNPPVPGLVTIPLIKGVEPIYYSLAGFRLLGVRAIRIDMLERLADLIRVQDFKNGFEATAEMLSITGLTLLQFKDLMLSLGYKIKSFKRLVSSEMEIKDQKKITVKNDKINKDILENTIQNSNDLNEIEEEYFLFIFNFKRLNKNKTQESDILKNQKKNEDGKVKKTRSTKKIIYSDQEKKHRADEVDPDSPFATLAALIKN